MTLEVRPLDLRFWTRCWRMCSSHLVCSSVSRRPASRGPRRRVTRSSAVNSGDVFERCPLHHRDDVDECLVMGGLEGALQVRDGEVLGRLGQGIS